MRFFIIFIFVLSLVSCKRKKVEKTHPEFIGTWEHIISNNKIQRITITDYGRGCANTYENNELQQEHCRQWFIKDDYLLLGRMSKKKDSSQSSFAFKIDLYPTTSTSILISNYDTVKAGGRYIILNGNMYVGN